MFLMHLNIILLIIVQFLNLFQLKVFFFEDIHVTILMIYLSIVDE